MLDHMVRPCMRWRDHMTRSETRGREETRDNSLKGSTS